MTGERAEVVAEAEAEVLVQAVAEVEVLAEAGPRLTTGAR